MTNRNLSSARASKNDEFYTELSDIQDELKNYTDKFAGKIVFCNCDDPFRSNFVKYFLTNFHQLGLKRLYASGYLLDFGGVCRGQLLQTDGHRMQYFDFDSDFRSDASAAILQQADIIVTNPPFSLFREYIAQLMQYEKQFLIIGSINAITYKEIFPLLKQNRMWIGCKSMNQDMYFTVPDERQQWLLANKKEGSAYKIIQGRVMGRLASACWFTNLDHAKRHIRLPLDLGFTYAGHEKDYSKYDNYDAINVDKVSRIPCDYMGVMGVPVTFLDKYCPEQFVLIGHEHDLDGSGHGGDVGQFEVNGCGKYKRILIQRKI